MAQAIPAILGAVGGIGGALGGGKDDSETQTVTQRTTIPPFLRPFVTREARTRNRALRRLEGQLAGAGAQHLVEPLTEQQQQAIDLLTERAGGAGGFIPEAQNVFLGAARGEVSPETRDAAATFRDFTARDPLQDPAIREATTAAVRSILPEISSTFAASGRTGSGLERAAIGQATSDALTRLLGQERQRRLSAGGALARLGSGLDARRLAAAGALPGLVGIEPDLLLQAGGLLQQQGQRELEAPISAQERLLAASSGTPVSALLGRSGQRTSPLFSNPAAGALGGGLAGLQFGSNLAGLFDGDGLTGDFSNAFVNRFANLT